MKHLHFFGCSFTVGQELPDDDLFPWKKNCVDAIDYYTKVRGFTCQDYIDQCKSMAYPQIIENSNLNWKCFNHATLGSSIKEIIYNVIQLVEENKQHIDFIVVQIPLYTREFAVNRNEECTSYSINYHIANNNEFNEYLNKSVMFHSFNHWALHALIDLLLLEGYLLSKNIKFVFLDLELSKEEIAASKKLKIPRPNKDFTLILKNNPSERLLGGHFNRADHERFAQVLLDDIAKRI